MAKILVVEDDPTAQEFYRNLLEDYVELLVAPTIEKAIRQFHTHEGKFDLIAMDGTVGTQDTAELIQMIREKGGFKGTILAASTSPRSSEKLVQAGADEIIVKERAPDRILELLPLIEKDQATLARMTEHIQQNGPSFQVTSFLLVGDTSDVKATAILDDGEFTFYTNAGKREAYEEFRRNGLGNLLADKAIGGSL